MAKDLVQNQRSPRVSVIMSVYNGEKYLSESIESILSQSFMDFEFIIIDDGSTDRTLKIIKSYKDDRIIVFSRKNKGLVASLNEGISKARGKYIARQDADDVSLTTRLKKEVDYLDRHENYVAIGTWFEEFGSDTTHYLNRPPISDSLSRLRLIWGTCFGHGTVMFDRQAGIRAGLYRENRWPAEDYDFWTRLSRQGKICNLPEKLYRYRVHKTSISIENSQLQVQKSSAIASENIKYYRGQSAKILKTDCLAVIKMGENYVDFVADELTEALLRLRMYSPVRKDLLYCLYLLKPRRWLRVKLRLLFGR